MENNWFSKYRLAHRGLHNEKYPENSLGAFENAIKHKLAIELDVRLLKDGTIVIMHDSNILRMCGVNKNLADMYEYELSEMFLNKTKYNIPTLKEVLELVNGKVPLMIELKPIRHNKKHILEKSVYELIKDYKGDIAVKSFHPLSMLWFKKNAPEITRGMLGSYFEHTHLPKLYKNIIKKMSFYSLIKPHFISYDFRYLPNKYVKKKNVPIVAWTITSEKLEEEALKFADTVVFENYIPSSPIIEDKKATK